MKRIGILGGTFNPIHLGHLTMAQIAQEKASLAKVIFVPSCLPPHKSNRGVILSHHRLKMVKLAIRGNPAFEVSDFEIKQGGKSYSINTIEHFRKKYPKGTKFYFIIGTDMVAGIRRWKRFNGIVKLATFVAVDRPKSRKKSRFIKHYLKVVTNIDISSSEIRRRILQSKTVKYLVPDNVERYIKMRKLYRN